jgi:hypothetical protein
MDKDDIEAIYAAIADLGSTIPAQADVDQALKWARKCEFLRLRVSALENRIAAIEAALKAAQITL